MFVFAFIQGFALNSFFMQQDNELVLIRFPPLLGVRTLLYTTLNSFLFTKT